MKSGFCPTLWDIEMENGEKGYIRYRSNYLVVVLSGREIYRKEVKSPVSGAISLKTVKTQLKGFIQ